MRKRETWEDGKVNSMKKGGYQDKKKRAKVGRKEGRCSGSGEK